MGHTKEAYEQARDRILVIDLAWKNIEGIIRKNIEGIDGAAMNYGIACIKEQYDDLTHAVRDRCEEIIEEYENDYDL